MPSFDSGRALVFVAACLAAAGLRAAQDDSAGTSPENFELPKEVRERQAQTERLLHQQHTGAAQNLIRMQEERLRALKESSPEAYQRQVEALERHKAIEDIVSRTRQKKLDPAAAADKLMPLVRKDMASELGALKERAARLERKLDRLRKAEKDPDSLVRERVEQLLGQRKPSPPDFQCE